MYDPDIWWDRGPAVAPARRPQITEADDDAIRTYEHEAASRCIDYVTFRRIARLVRPRPVTGRFWGLSS